MKIFILIIFCFSLITFPGRAQETQQLKRKIDSLLTTEKGDFAVAFRDAGDPENYIFINGHENFHAASTMKTPVMLEVFKQVREGKFKLSDSLLVKNEFKSIVDRSSFSLDISRDGGEQLYEQIGTYRSIEDLVTDMIIYSSNLATNIVIELVGAKNVNATLRELGAQNMNVLRGVEDMRAYDAGLNNSTTAYDLLLVLEAIGNGTAVDKDSGDKMVDILLMQKDRIMIPALLPENVKVANKTGMITGVHHDSAIVFLPGGDKYVLVLLSKNVEEMERATNMLAQVSLLVYEHMKGRKDH